MNKRDRLEEQVEQIARTMACERYAAMIWRDKDWDWFFTLRETIVRMLRRGEQLEIRHLQFAWFVQVFLTTGSGACLTEQDRFLRCPGSAELDALVESLPRWTIDQCEIFA